MAFDRTTATQSYQPLDSDLTTIAAIANTDGNIIVGNGSNWVAEGGSVARESLGLAIGTDVMAHADNNAVLDATQQWTKAQVPYTRTAAFEQPNFDTYQNFVFTLASGTNAFTEPSTEASNAGQTGVIVLIQPTGGDGVVTWHTDYKPVGGTVADLSDSNGAVDILPYCIQADNNILIGAPQLDLKATS